VRTIVRIADSNWKHILLTGRSSRTGLARALSKLGYCSRSEARRLITEGRVQLNGYISRNPEAPVRMGTDRVEVNGEKVVGARRIYLMLNKPRGIVTTARDEKGRDTVYGRLQQKDGWLPPVGRLDKASEGLLLFTNDSAWATGITAPESHLDKTYHVQIGSLADDGLLARLRAGVRESGELLKAKRARVLRQGQKNCWIEIVLDEGKNRHIRRTFAALGIEVLRLVRIAIGELRLGALSKGEVRDLTPQEVKKLATTERK
jgi:23S rRNA pseudouridine2605 synthase